MSTPNSSQGKPATPARDKRAGADPGGEVPTHPEDTTASGDAHNATGEDNQGRHGDRPAEDYIRR